MKERERRGVGGGGAIDSKRKGVQTKQKQKDIYCENQKGRVHIRSGAECVGGVGGRGV